MDHSLVIEQLVPSEFTQGIQLGDKILKINGQNACDYYSNRFDILEEYCYEIYSVAKNKVTQVTSPIPIGVKASPNSEYLAKQLKSHIDYQEFEYFETLWERNELKLLKTVISNISLKNPLLFLTRKFSQNTLWDTPFILFKGIVNFHNGNLKKAAYNINYYHKNVMASYTTNFHAICHLYLSLLSTSPSESEQHLNESNNYNKSRSKRINNILTKHSIKNIPLNEIENTQFPVSFILEGLEQEKSFSLDEQLDAMDEDTLLPLCVMPYYRANGPYCELMTIYTQMYSYLNKRLLPIHIITNIDQGNCQDWWFNGENLAKSYNIPFELLDDPEMEISSYLEQDISPAVYVLNKDKKVVYQGLLNDPYDYWKITQ